MGYFIRKSGREARLAFNTLVADEYFRYGFHMPNPLSLYWIGPRESDIRYAGDMFAGSITLYGTNSDGNTDFCSSVGRRINHNIVTDEQQLFIVNEQNKRLEANPEARFMSYNPLLVYALPESRKLSDRTECLNDEPLLEKLDNKQEFRELASQTIKVLESRLLSGKECRYDQLIGNTTGKSGCAFIVQEIKGAVGGQGTYFITNRNDDRMIAIQDDSRYLVSEYLNPNIPVNVHCLIFDKRIIVLQPSIQLIHPHNSRLLYYGDDYIAYREIDADIDRKVREEARKLCHVLQDEGYRGILGLDAIIVGKEILFLEINPRFQGSSPDINRTLWERGLPSLHELNLQAFSDDAPKTDGDTLEKLPIGFSSFSFSGTHKDHIANIYKNSVSEPSVVDFVGNAFHSTQPSEYEAHQYTLQFNRNISSVIDGGLRIHQNLLEPSEAWSNSIKDIKEKEKLKISLLNQGAKLSHQAKMHLSWHGGMMEGVYHSLDIDLNGDKYNIPLKTQLAVLSPFEVDYSDGKFVLRYYEHGIASITLDIRNRFLTKSTSKGIPLGRMLLLATDRLRIQHNSFCTFVEKKKKCQFCEAVHFPIEFDTSDVLDAIDAVFAQRRIPFRHIMIGGLSNHIGREKPAILEICQRIRKYSEMPIYLMCLPPKDLTDIDHYVDGGVSEIGFNLEVFDRNIARRIMPGKGLIPLEQYDAAFKHAVDRLKEKGAVYSAFVVGLEPKNSLLKGIEHVCRLGVRPILSPFLALPNTPMQNTISLNNEVIYAILKEIREQIEKYDLERGPMCLACRNNTL